MTTTIDTPTAAEPHTAVLARSAAAAATGRVEQIGHRLAELAQSQHPCQEGQSSGA